MKILTYPNPELGKKAKVIKKISEKVKHLARQMLDLMYKEGGVGLAAPQVGNPIQLIVINLTKKPLDEMVLINPLIDKKTGRLLEEEGCLSLPGIKAKVPRYKRIICRALNLKGKEIIIDTGLTLSDQKQDAAELLCRAIQHEMDHLEGILFIDYLSESERKAITKKLQT